MKKILFCLMLFLLPQSLFSMHIMEGFLPMHWAALWWLLIIPFLFLGMKRIRTIVTERPELKMLLAIAGAFAFVLSALKLPSVTGSSSHATGVGLGALLFGPIPMVVLGFIVLLFQALLLAHGGITTLGANTFSMGLCGPVASFAVFKLCKRLTINDSVSIFLGASIGDLVTYLVTALELALAHPDAQSGFAGSMTTFTAIFAVTQIPLALSEGFLTVVVINVLKQYASEDMHTLSILKLSKGGRA